MRPRNRHAEFVMPAQTTWYRRELGGSIGLHAIMVFLIIWGGLRAAGRAAGTGDGYGPAGGGGGGGAPKVTYVELPPFPTQPAAPRAPVPDEDPLVFKIPKPQIKQIVRPVTKLKIIRPHGPILKAVKVGRGKGTSGGVGQVAGRGGGKGTGVGTGTGSNMGPGTGGKGGAVLAPEPRAVIYPTGDPAPDVRGQVLKIHFWVDARGKVTKVRVKPKVKDKAYRKQLLERMYQWTFYPARTADGSPVKGELEITYTP
ncbi:MAG: energy transducer TonB [Gemmatimonadales bacterium]